MFYLGTVRLSIFVYCIVVCFSSNDKREQYLLRSCSLLYLVASNLSSQRRNLSVIPRTPHRTYTQNVSKKRTVEKYDEAEVHA